MPIADSRYLIVAVLFGLAMGYGLGRRSGDRKAALWSLGLAAGLGIGLWLTSPDQDGAAAIAAVSLTVGGSSGFVACLLSSRGQ